MKHTKEWLNKRASYYALRIEFRNRGTNNIEVFRDTDTSGSYPVGRFLTQAEFIAFTDGISHAILYKKTYTKHGI